MTYATIAYYIKDPAGRGIVQHIVEIAKCDAESIQHNDIEELKEKYLCRNYDIVVLGFDIDVINFEILKHYPDSEFYVVTSRHSARSGKPSLTTHTPGNPWKRNDAGGIPWELPPSNPVLMWYIIRELNKYGERYELLNEYEVCYEVTHHGPTSLTKPITFVELGSSEKEWIDNKAQEVIALATLEAIKNYRLRRNEIECIVTVGFGGSHYAPIFTRRAFEEKECYGHMIPNYVIRELSLKELEFVSEKAIMFTPGSKRIVIEKMRKELRDVIERKAKYFNLEIIRY